MGVTFDRSARIAGYRPSTFKSSLRGYLRTRSRASFIDLKSVFPLRRDGAIVYEECLDRSLIDAASGEVAYAGQVVAGAKILARTPLENAQCMMEEFLGRVEQLNNDPEAVSRVDQVWLFGSLMREEANVGDIDLAITRSRDMRFDGDLDAQVDQAKKLIEKFEDAPQYWAWPWGRIDWLFRRAIFGPRRHPLLAGAQEGTADLVSLGVPCRLIYDRARGGRVDDPILPRHPESPGRSNSMSPPAALPELAPAQLQPMDARWVAGFDARGCVSPYHIFRGWTEECHQLFPHFPRNLRIVADGHQLGGFPWTPKSVRKKGLDGRAAVAIVDATEFWGVCITLHRTIERRADGWVLLASFSDLALHRSRKYVDLASLPDMVAAVSLILAVDAERILRRATEADSLPKVTIHISQDDLPEDMRKYFAQEIADMLTRRAVAIEPKGEGGTASIVLG